MKIKSINLELNGQKVEITIEEAKNLYRQLKELVGNEREYYPVYPSYPYWDTSPYWKEQMPWWHEPVTCSSGSGKGGDYSVLTENGVETRSVVNFSDC